MAATGCQDSTRPGSPLEPPPPVSADYVCGNGFDLENRHPSPVIIHYDVTGTAEEGELMLPARLDPATPSTTRLVTLQTGGLRVSYEGTELGLVDNQAAACPPPSDPKPKGEWADPFPWPVVAVHLHLLPDGKVLSWGAVGDPQVWDPATSAFAGAPSRTHLFCSGHAFLPDGRLLVAGGHISIDHGLPDANIFDPPTQSWTAIAPMSRGRWYPTNTTLTNGQILTLAGRDESGAEVDLPEVWTGDRWIALSGARRVLPYYPRTFAAPNGMVFYAGELKETAHLDPAGSGQWTPVASSNYGRRDYGSAVMYRPGEIMIVGGSDPPDGAPTNTAELIDLTAVVPAWRYTDPMTYARRHHNATLLPDGTVLVTGGTSSPGFSDAAGAVRASELWDPVTERWTTLASSRVTRVYHSTALLLPDARVLVAGSGDGAGLPRELNAEFYSPPYLFRGPQPWIRATSEVMSYGGSFYVETPDAGRAVRASLVRLGSVTHGFDQNQRFLQLTVRRAVGGLLLESPVTSDLAPPGDYLLFILTDDGVPSKGITIRLR
ncbi:MAG TPA: galactose oxidase-like domain-containing protein [Gemmatimonadales bacterium]